MWKEVRKERRTADARADGKDRRKTADGTDMVRSVLAAFGCRCVRANAKSGKTAKEPRGTVG
jgi:hypothetical protein